MSFHAAIVTATTLLAAVATGLGGRLVRLDLISQDAMPKIGDFLPWTVTILDERPVEIRRIPDDVTAPTFGQFDFGSLDLPDRRVFVVIDEPVDRAARFFVDANRNGDLTDDAAAEWRPETQSSRNGAPYVRYRGGARVGLGAGATPSVRIGFMSLDREARERFDLEPDLQRFRDYARAGTIDFSGKAFSVLLDDARVVGDFRGDPKFRNEGVAFLIDVNGNGVFDVRGESFDSTEPFNIGGTTYEVSEMTSDGSSFRLSVSSQHVDEIPPPPDQSAGQTILAFEATTLDGRRIRFPDAYRDRVVLLDIWATWCGPCRTEVPVLVAAHEKYRDHGFEIVSISIDAADARSKVVDFARSHAMAWAHVHDAGGWDGQLAQLFCPPGIPAGYLVEGRTGRILAAGNDVRGEKLATAIERALNARGR